MKRIGAGLLVLSFIVGVLIVPMVHRLHCDDHHATHEAAKCPICQVAHTSIITAALHIAPVGVAVVVRGSVLPQLPVICPLLRGAALARAPPVA